MKNRPPFHINKIVIAYNAYQVIISSWFCLLYIGLDKPLEALVNSICSGLTKNQKDYVNK